MTKRWMMAGAAMLALAGCAASSRPDAGGPIAIEADSIRYETSPCYGRCPVYAVSVRPDGRGVFIGKQHTAVTGERTFQLTPAQYEAFAAKLAPYRPAGGEVRYAPGEARCEPAATDGPSVDITWTRAIGDSQSLHFYYGCRGEGTQAMRDAIGQAPELLPIDALIGPRP